MILFITSGIPGKYKKLLLKNKQKTYDENLKGWVEYLSPDGSFKIVSIDDQSLNSHIKWDDAVENDLLNLCSYAIDPRFSCIVAFGEKVSSSLAIIGIEHFKMPLPSIELEIFNKKEYMDAILEECKEYIDKRYRGLN